VPAISVGSVEVDVVPNTRGIHRKLTQDLVAAATQAGRSAGNAAGEAFGPAMTSSISDSIGERVGTQIGRQIAVRITGAIRNSVGDGIRQGGQAARPAATRQGADTGGAFARSLRTKLQEAFRSMPKLNVSLSDTGVDADLARLRARMETLSDKTIGIDISAEAARAQAADIEERLRRLGAAHPNVAVRADTARAIAQLQAVQAQVDELGHNNATIRVETDGKLGARLRAAVQAAQASLPNINIGANTSPAQTEIAQLRARLTALSDKKVGIDISAGAAMAEIAKIRARLVQLSSKNADVAVRVDAGAASAQLTAFVKQVRALDGKTAKVDVDTTSAVSGMSMLITTAIAVGPALLPALPIAAAGLGAIAAAGVAAGVGIASIGAVAMPALKDISGALQAQKAAQDAATAASTKGSQASGQGASKALQMAGAQQSLATAHRNAAQQISQGQRAVADAVEGGAQRVRQAQDGVKDAVRSAAEANRSAAQQVRAAQQSVADAVQQAADRQRDAAERVTQAEGSLADAQRTARQAQQDLTQARKDAALELAEMSNRLADAQLSERDAALSVQEAGDRLRATQADGSKATLLQQQRAQLAYDQAVQRLKEQQAETKNLAAAKKAADKAGIEGSGTVKSAQERLAGAQRDVGAQQKALAKAHQEAAQQQIQGTKDIAAAQVKVSEVQRSAARTQEDGARSVARAQREVTQASEDSAEGVARAQEQLAQARMSAADSIASAQRQIASASQQAAGGVDQAAAAQAKYQAALAKMTPAARGTFNAFVSLRSAFTAWSRSLQPQVMPIFTRAIDGLRRSLPGLTPFVKAAAVAIGGLQDRVSRGFKSPWWKEFKTDLQGSVGPAITALGISFGRIFKGMGGIIQAFLPHMDSISERMQRITGRFANWGTGLKGSPEFERFLSYSAETGPKLAHALGQIGGAFLSISQALSPLSGPLLMLLGGMAEAIGIIATHAPWMVKGIWLLIVVMRVWTIVQWALNAAMSANPLVLIGIALVALVALVIYAYNRFGWFRTAVQAVWRAVQASVSAVINWFKGPFVNFFTQTIPAVFRAVLDWVRSNWPWILGALTGPIGLAVGMIIKHWADIRAGLLAAWNAIVRTVIAPIGRFFTKTIPGWAGKVRDQVVARWRSLRDGLSAAWTAVRNRVINPLRDFFTRTIPGWASRVRDQVVARWRSLRDGLSAVWGAVKSRVINPLRDFFTKKIPGWAGTLKDKVVGAFQRARDGIKTAWSKIQDIAKKPIRFIINTVYNKGIVPVWNKIATAFGAKKINKMDISGWNTGGVLPGYTPGKDVHLAALSGGEAVMRPEWTRAVGPGYVDTMNAAARGGGIPGVQKALGLPGYKDGGIFGWVGKAKNTLAGWGSSAWDKVKSGAKWLKDTLASSARAGVKSVVNPLLNKIPGLDNGFGRMVKGIPTRIVDTLFGYADKADEKGASGVGAGSGIWRKPVNVGYGTPFGKAGKMWSSGHHTGLDFPAPTGTPVRAVADGTVSQVASGGPYGKHVMIGHGGGLSSLYGHMSRIMTKLHAHVTQGQQIGKVGATGNVTGPHLHLEARINGKAVDPMRYLAGGAAGSGGNVQAVGAAQQYAKSILGRYGWGPGQFAPLKQLWQHESGWRWNADNPSSDAYGIPQALPGSKMASAGADWRTNAATQIDWGEGYIKDRPDYGSPARAWAAWKSRSPHWYDSGGYLQPGLNLAYNGTGKPEPVFTRQQASALAGGGGTSSSGLQAGDTLTLVVDGQEFHGYVDRRANARVQDSQQRLMQRLRAR
jgi:hypothetical protein